MGWGKPAIVAGIGSGGCWLFRPLCVASDLMSRLDKSHTAAPASVAAQVEPCPVFTVAQVRAKFFPGRCARWIKEQFRPGTYGPVFFDGSCWFISSQAIAGWQRAHRVAADAAQWEATK